jgi:hypothetical protein
VLPWQDRGAMAVVTKKHERNPSRFD